MIYTVTLNPARDRTVVIPGFEAGRVNRVQSLRDDAGGKGINVSKGIHALGGNTIALGILGGETGKFIQNSLTNMGIPCDFLKVRAETRTNIKVVDPINHVTTDINEPGETVSKRVLTGLFARLSECVKTGDIVVFAGKPPAGTRGSLVAEWTRKLSKSGARVFLDADSETLAEGVKAAPYLIKPNLAELSELLGERLTADAEIQRAARRVLAGTGIKVCAVSMGAQGAMFVSEEETLRAEGLKVNVKGTVGAGDTMMAALAYGFDSGMSLFEAARWAMAASAASVTYAGTEIVPRRLVEELLKQVQIERFKR